MFQELAMVTEAALAVVSAAVTEAVVAVVESPPATAPPANPAPTKRLLSYLCNGWTPLLAVTTPSHT